MKRQALMATAVLSLALAALPIGAAHSSYHYHHETHSAWKKATVLATAYVVHHDYGCETYTAKTSSGTIATRGTIATDPRIFPIGTRFRIPHYGYGIARDTGGYIRRRHIDLAVASCKEAINWGAKRIVVYYLLPHTGVSS